MRLRCLPRCGPWVLALLGAAAVGAADGTPAREPAAGPHFADLTTVPYRRILPPPPEPGSAGERRDLTTLLAAQAWRTPAQIVWARQVDDGDMMSLFAADTRLGPAFRPRELPVLATLCREFVQDFLRSGAYKEAYPRLRPALRDPRVVPVVAWADDGAYPSGHATVAYFWAAVLSDLLPEQRAYWWQRAEEIAWGRVLGGVHYPTDLQGGRRLAAALLEVEMKNAAFLAALERCRAELAAKRQPQAA